MAAIDVITAIPEKDTTAAKDTFTSSGGVVLKLKPVSPFLVADSTKRLKQPRPPLVYVPGKETQEPNEADPDYIASVREYNSQVADTSNGVQMTFGTEIVHIPDGFPKPSDSEWADEIMEMAPDIVIPASVRRRYYCWLKYVVTASGDDYLTLLRALGEVGGVTREEDVAEATTDFRSDPQGTAAAGTLPEAGDQLGDSNTTGVSGAST